jgi:hypothetical protein
MPTLLIACALAFVIGAVTARRLRVLGLVVVLGLLVAGGIAGMVTDLPNPTLLESALLMAAVQAGYLAGALGLGGRARAPSAPPPLAKGKDRAAG